MRPEHKLILSCRQAGERAERLLEWLEQSRMMLQAPRRALVTDVQCLAAELSVLVEAAERPPCVAVVGPVGCPRAELLGSLMQDGASNSAGADDDTQVAFSRERVLAMLPRSGIIQAAGVRLASARTCENPYRFPLRVAMLSQVELVKILALGYLRHVPAAQQRSLSASDIVERLAAKTDDFEAQTFSGISQRDVDGVRECLHTAAPEHPKLRQLDAAGYWDTLGGMIAHLPDAVCRKGFALLWGGEPALTTLFDRLSDAIQLMGFSGEAYTGLDALLGRDPSTGWLLPHDTSLIAAHTLAACVDAPHITLRVASRHGRSTDVERFALAALTAEVRLPVDPGCFSLLETAELVALPPAPSVLLWPKTDGAGTPSARAPLTRTDALEIFAAQKAVYLLERSVRQHDVTSLLAVTDSVDDPEAVRLDPAAGVQIANWIELTQGITAQARERRRTGLSVLATRSIAAVQASPDDQARWFEATLAPFFDDRLEWVREWTPNRPFGAVYNWAPARQVALTAAPASNTRDAGRAEATQAEAGDVLRFDRSGGAEPAIAELSLASNLSQLQQAIAQSTTAAVRQQQLQARLSEIRRELSARFLRLHQSNDPIGVIEWRRQVCQVARNRIERADQRGAFGRLQRALLQQEVEAAAVLARIKMDDPRASMTRVVDLRSLEPQRIVERCMESWISAMRQLTRATAFLRAVGMPSAVLANMIDELTLGAVRIGLQEKLTEAVRRIQLRAEPDEDCAPAIAALVARGINAYVEALDPGARGRGDVGGVDTRFGMGTLAGRKSETTGARLPTVASAWAEAFVDLVEANILGAALLGGAGHLNRELGEVLGALSPQSHEVVQ